MSPWLSVADFEQFIRWLFGDVLGWANLIQIPALALTGTIPWLLCRPVRTRLAFSIEQIEKGSHLDWLVHHRSWVIDCCALRAPAGRFGANSAPSRSGLGGHR